MIAVSMESTASETMQAILVCDPPESEAACVAYRSAFTADPEFHKHLARAIEIDGLLAIHMLDLHYAGAAPPWAGRQSPPHLLGMLQYHNTALAKRHKPLDFGRLREWYQRGPAPLTCSNYPNVMRAMEACYQSEDLTRLTIIALGLMQYRIRKEKDAPDLALLVPRILPRLPGSAWDGAPPRMISGHSQALRQNSSAGLPENVGDFPAIGIYMLGQNGQDDGGKNSHPPDDILLLMPMRSTTLADLLQEEKR